MNLVIMVYADDINGALNLQKVTHESFRRTSAVDQETYLRIFKNKLFCLAESLPSTVHVMVNAVAETIAAYDATKLAKMPQKIALTVELRVLDEDVIAERRTISFGGIEMRTQAEAASSIFRLAEVAGNAAKVLLEQIALK